MLADYTFDYEHADLEDTFLLFLFNVMMDRKQGKEQRKQALLVYTLNEIENTAYRYLDFMEVVEGADTSSQRIHVLLKKYIEVYNHIEGS